MSAISSVAVAAALLMSVPAAAMAAGDNIKPEHLKDKIASVQQTDEHATVEKKLKELRTTQSPSDVQAIIDFGQPAELL